MDESYAERQFGTKVDNLEPAPPPKDGPIHGALVTLSRLQSPHAEAFYAQLKAEDVWDYLAGGPFKTKEEFVAYISALSQKADPFFYVILANATSQPIGYIALMNMIPSNHVCEVGHVTFSPTSLQRTRAATEVFHLLLHESFTHLRSRRVEWKCNTLNEPSKRAAVRLGFSFEGIFRSHSIVKGRNRDSAWYSMLESEWPEARRGFELWQDERNFDGDGKQRKSLAVLRKANENT